MDEQQLTTAEKLVRMQLKFRIAHHPGAYLFLIKQTPAGTSVLHICCSCREILSITIRDKNQPSLIEALRGGPNGKSDST